MGSNLPKQSHKPKSSVGRLLLHNKKTGTLDFQGFPLNFSEATTGFEDVADFKKFSIYRRLSGVRYSAKGVVTGLLPPFW